MQILSVIAHFRNFVLTDIWNMELSANFKYTLAESVPWNQFLGSFTELEFLKSLWGLGTEEE
jgi:hypothetical protein